MNRTYRLSRTFIFCVFIYLSCCGLLFASEQVMVPDIYNTCGEDTDKILKKSGLRPKPIPVNAEPPGALEWYCAYGQIPKAGKIVKKGSVVKYKYSWERE